MRVLYVEDEKFLAEAVKHNLEKQEKDRQRWALAAYSIGSSASGLRPIDVMRPPRILEL